MSETPDTAGESVGLNFIPLDPPSIHIPSEEFDFTSPPFDPIAFAEKLVEIMSARRGIGLAAPQICVNYRIIAVSGDPTYVMYNPRIVATGQEDIVLEEGCLSFPGIFLKVRRPRFIKVRFTGPNGEVFTKEFDGVTSRIIQHEMDHLDGATMIDKADRFYRESAKRKLKQMKRRMNNFVKVDS